MGIGRWVSPASLLVREELDGAVDLIASLLCIAATEGDIVEGVADGVRHLVTLLSDELVNAGEGDACGVGDELRGDFNLSVEEDGVLHCVGVCWVVC